MPRPIAVLVGAVLLLATSACRDDGRDLAPAPTVPDSLVTTTVASSVQQLTLASPAFDDGGFLDPAFTCDGVDVPPPLTISGAPPSAVELAIVVTDATAERRVHWVVSGFAPTLTQLEAGTLPPDAVVARGDGGIEGWEGPCPPAGGDPHAYEFTLHALAEPVGLVPGIDGRQAIELLEQASIASDSIVGFYGSERAG